MSRTLLLCLCLFVTAAGCGELFEKTEMVELDKVPEPVMEAAKKKLPDVKFETAWTEKAGDKTNYEVRGKDKNGKTRDVKVSPTGEILEVD
jgi:uncharacterized membrane protein YkoI